MIGLLGLAAGIYAIDTQLKKRRRKRPLSRSQPDYEYHPLTPDSDLGLEAVDLKMVDSVNKENERLEKLNGKMRRPLRRMRAPARTAKAPE
ncbi:MULTISPECIES: hypothetical protein [unclassified Leisingera]|uniref:hypothetical protein n=1 Tax=unclassified Leisingera TaxID=2614906 RepID=UPI00057D9FFC|nr:MULTISPECIES: hypothetical protein [unclassified Leisingera]